jgi:DNA-binding transcriptional MerR regulator
VEAITIGEASARSGWSRRMLRYLEELELVVPGRTAAGYRRYDLRELNQLRTLGELRGAFGVELDDLAFVLRIRREPDLHAAVETWLTGTTVPATDLTSHAWVEWEQRKHERLLASQAA